MGQMLGMVVTRQLEIFYTRVATKFPANALNHRPFLLEYIVSSKLCTLEFEIHRASYYWLLDAPGLHKPYVWEYSRLNILNTVMSKCKVRLHRSLRQ
ncbi:glutamine--tRNA ligase-like isoform X1 [Asparagus officinalis]|uniref:glutamine--tRNA ligase-like isoform X1 n=2 Tax=Asparagus officinalis TaxID=4686 RepID=UPI00098E2F42|nr:glutamine--tRNA ligase-like isoform X1 [Asparagus officinalis]